MDYSSFKSHFAAMRLEVLPRTSVLKTSPPVSTAKIRPIICDNLEMVCEIGLDDRKIENRIWAFD